MRGVKTIGVRFVPTCGMGVYVGVFLVSTRESKMFEMENGWSPDRGEGESKKWIENNNNN